MRGTIFRSRKCFDMMRMLFEQAILLAAPRHSSVAQWQSIRLLTGGL